LGVLAVGLIIVGGVLAWRLTSGPISIAFLTPYFETALSSRTGSYVIDVDDTILKWVGGDRAVDLILRGAQVLSPEGQMFAQVPELSISLSAPALMRGEIAPKSLLISGAKISVIRNFDGSLGIELPQGQRSSEGLVLNLLEEFVRTSEDETALAELSRIEIDNASVSVDDRQMGVVWKAPKANMTLNRGATGLAGRARLDLELGSQLANVTIHGSFLSVNREISLTFGFADISPSRLAGISKEFEAFRLFDTPVTGSVAVRMALNGIIESVDFDLESDAGQISVPGPFPLQAVIRSARARGAFDQARSVLDIENLTLDFGNNQSIQVPKPVNHRVPIRGISASVRYWLESEKLEVGSFVADLAGPKLEATAVVQEIADELNFELSGTALNFGFKGLDTYWPETFGSIAREWIVKNIPEGEVPTARAKISGQWNAAKGVSVDTLIGDMIIRNATVDYLAPMPPVRKASGLAKFNLKTFDIKVASGHGPGLEVEEGRVLFTGLDQFDQFADIDMTIRGSLKSALRLIDSEPLEFAKAVNLSPTSVKGDGSARVELDFLVERAMTADDVKVLVEATLNDVAVPGVVLGHGLDSGELTLKADKDGLNVTGLAMFGNVPMDLTWQEIFDDSVESQSLYTMTARISAEQFRGLTGMQEMPFSPDYLSGIIGVSLNGQLTKEGAGEFDVEIDLTDANLAIPQIEWQKSGKVESLAKLSAQFGREGLTGIKSFALNGGGIELAGDISFARNAIQNINVAKFLLGGTEVAGRVTKSNDGWSVRVNGPRLDLAAALERQDTLPDPVEPGPRLTVEMDIGRVEIADGKYLYDVSGSMENDGWVWSRIEAIANIVRGKPIAVNLTPRDGKRTLTVGADDAGAVLKNLGYYNNIVGGKLALKAEYEDMTPSSRISGQVLIEDFRLVDAPVLARLLSVASITGIPGELAGAGLSFQQFDVPFTKEAGMVHIKGAKAGGFNLGVTANGTIDTELEILDIKGSVAPLDKLNSLLGNIPLFGVFFSAGEKGGGVFAADYSMKGSFDDPEISTNPLSALTPGIFRKIFDAFPDRRSPKSGPDQKDFDPAK